MSIAEWLWVTPKVYNNSELSQGERPENETWTERERRVAAAPLQTTTLTI